jgi:hypothetical protein
MRTGLISFLDIIHEYNYKVNKDVNLMITLWQQLSTEM